MPTNPDIIAYTSLCKWYIERLGSLVEVARHTTQSL